MHQDFPDRRTIFIKTDRHAEMDEVRKLPGVTVTETESSNLYVVSGIVWNESEMEKNRRILEAEGTQAARDYRSGLRDHFYKAAWPAAKQQIKAAIARHDPGALLHEIDDGNQGGEIILFLETKSRDLIEALRAIDHAMVNEQRPDTTRAQLSQDYQLRLVKSQARQTQPAKPAGPSPS